jgi:pimeloyl-ACP methyl ester carboxylesterase
LDETILRFAAPATILSTMVTDRWIQLPGRNLTLHVREWMSNPIPGRTPFLLVHGLASNARTWDQVAALLAQAGHAVYAVDQRGHGLSEKPDAGYDFATVTADLTRLLDALEIDRTLLVGQSWGGNVTLAFGARYPDRVQGLGFVDGGYLDLQMRAEGSWEAVARDLKPPSLAGIPVADMTVRMQNFHPAWSEAGIEGTMANFELLPDGTIRPWLTLERHMRILRALWEQRPSALYPQIAAPVYIAVAEQDGNPAWMAEKRTQVAAAETGLAQVAVEWFPATDHDIHVHRPEALAASFLAHYGHGIWSDR